MNCLSSLLYGNTFTCVKYVTWLQRYSSCYIWMELMFEVPAYWHWMDCSGPLAGPLWPVARVGGLRLAAGVGMPHGGHPRCEFPSSWSGPPSLTVTRTFSIKEQDSSSSPQFNFLFCFFSCYECSRTFSQSSFDVNSRICQCGDAQHWVRGLTLPNLISLDFTDGSKHLKIRFNFSGFSR